MEQNFRQKMQEDSAYMVSHSIEFKDELISEAEDLNEQLRKFREKLADNQQTSGNRFGTLNQALDRYNDAVTYIDIDALRDLLLADVKYWQRS